MEARWLGGDDRNKHSGRWQASSLCAAQESWELKRHRSPLASPAAAPTLSGLAKARVRTTTTRAVYNSKQQAVSVADGGAYLFHTIRHGIIRWL
jgi:hypothetical protein